MELQPRIRLGAMPGPSRPNLNSSLRVTALIILGFSALLPAHASAGAPFLGVPPVVSPLDKEQDQQNKLRQQEKIERELEEQRRRVLKESERKWLKGEYEVSPNSPHKQEAPGLPTRNVD